MLSPRVHGTFIRRRCRKAPTISDRQRATTYNEIQDRRNRLPSRNHQNRRWKKLCSTHLKGIRQPCNSCRPRGHFKSKCQPSCFNANSSSLSDKRKAVQSASAYSMTSVLTSSNSNFSEAEKELLRWHFRLGHISFTKVQHLRRSGILSHSEGARRLHKAAASLRHAPRCAACSFAKQKVRSSPGKKVSTIHDVAGKLKSDHIFPGKEVSVDHFACLNPGGRLKKLTCIVTVVYLSISVPTTFLSNLRTPFIPIKQF